MTDYNDGKWHIWGGGVCPVAGKSVIAAIWSGKPEDEELRGIVRPADDFQSDCWLHKSAGGTANIVAFRVIKEHREPREFWIDPQYKIITESFHAGFIHVREVLE